MKKWHRIALRYTSIWLIGTLTLLGALPFFRVSTVQRELDAADRLLLDGQPRDALAHLDRVATRASLYPGLAQRYACAAIRCCARVRDFRAAIQLAEDIRDGKTRDRRPSFTVWETLEAPSDRLINVYLCHSRGGEAPLSSGYETLLNEYQRAGDADGALRIAKEILAKGPGNSTARTIRDSAERRHAEEAAKTAAPPQPVPALPPAEPPENVAAEHLKLARAHLAAKQWDQASAECDAALAADPAAPGVEALKKLAASRDMKWGFTHRLSKVYDETGKLIRDVPPGSLVDVSGIKISPGAGDLAICRIIPVNGGTSNVLVRMKDLNLTSGPLNRATEEEKSLRRRYVQLLSELDGAKEDAAKARLKNNPYAREYDTALAAYNDYWAKVKSLQAQHKAATGDARVSLADQMKQLKGGDIQVGQALEKAKKDIDEWQKKNPAKSGDDHQVEAVRQELSALQSKLDALDGAP